MKATLIDEGTGATFAVTEMPPGDLPESCEIETILHLDDVDWSVVHAEPRTRPDYSKLGSLTLRLRLVEKVDLRNILFSLPSICNRLALLGNEASTGDECILLEDDWRQFELASRQLASESEAEIEAIRGIHEHARAKVGWREILRGLRVQESIGKFLQPNLRLVWKAVPEQDPGEVELDRRALFGIV